MPSKYIHSIRVCNVDSNSLGLIVDFQGCPARCRSCNTPLMWQQRAGLYTWSDVRLKIAKQKPSTVILSGGEPLCNPQISHYIHDAVLAGVDVVVQTSGLFPERLANVSEEVKFFEINIVGMIKDYEKRTSVIGASGRISDTINFLINTREKNSYALSLVYHPWLIDDKSLCKLVDYLGSMGASAFVLKGFKPLGCKDSLLTSYKPRITISQELVKKLAKRERKYGIKILTKDM